MIKIDSVFEGRGQTQLKRHVEAYFQVAVPDRIEQIKRTIFDPSKSLAERKEAYRSNQKTIGLLKPLFKKIKKAHIQLAKDQGFGNYLEFVLKRNGISGRKFDLFLKNVDVAIEDINKNLPFPRDIPDWYWSEFNIPDVLYYFKEDFQLNIPGDVFEKLEKYFPEFGKFKKRIKIKKITDVAPNAKFNKEDKTVTLEISLSQGLFNAFVFVHELGHAISFIKLADEGIDPYSKSKYWHEKNADKFKFEFANKSFPEEVKYATRGEILNEFISTFFEYNIYSDPDQDFDKAYARAINRCFPGKPRQVNNPFYVLEKGFIFRPLSTLCASVAQLELLVKE